MSVERCPLCSSDEITVAEILSPAEINRLYLKHFGVVNALKSESLSYLVCQSCDLGFFSPMESGDEKLYEQLQKFEWYYMGDKPEYHVAQSFLPDEGMVLEVGAGKAAFADIVGKERYVGLEFNDEAILRAKTTGIELRKESIEEHSQGWTSRYAAVVSFQVLEHVSEPSSFIKGCVDSLQSGGCLILAVPNHEGVCGLAVNNILDVPPHHVSHWSTKTMQYIAEQYNLELVSIDYEKVSGFHVLWGAKSIYEQKLRKLCGMRRSLIDQSVIGKIVGKFASIFARIYLPDMKSTKGHTILACYRKR